MASISLPTAALIAGGVSGAAGIASSVIGANAAKGAAKTQAQAATLAANNQLKEFEQVRGDVSPFVTGGQEALQGAEGLLGLGPNGFDPSKIQSALEATPGYQFTLNQGEKAVQNSYAAKGLGSSGAAIRGATDYATGLANMTYEQRLADYLGLAGQGQNAALGVGSLGVQSVLNQGNFATSAAAASAAGTVGAANALTSGLSGLAGSASNALLFSALGGGGGMFGASPTTNLSPSGTALAPHPEATPVQ